MSIVVADSRQIMPVGDGHDKSGIEGCIWLLRNLSDLETALWYLEEEHDRRKQKNPWICANAFKTFLAIRAGELDGEHVPTTTYTTEITHLTPNQIKYYVKELRKESLVEPSPVYPYKTTDLFDSYLDHLIKTAKMAKMLINPSL